MTIRGRTSDDDAAITGIVDSAFGGSAESKLVGALREAQLAAIELVAFEASAIIGHVLLSILDVTVDRRAVKALALAPVAVRPDRQRRGVGSALIRHGLDRARAAGWEAVIVLGDTAYYGRFGFSGSHAWHLAAPFSGESFMALALRPDALEGRVGRVVYPPAFEIRPPPVARPPTSPGRAPP